MKIIIDKVTSEPNHSVSKKDIETVIRHVPSEWIGIKNVFKICSQLSINSQWDRPVIENGITFMIMSRGFSRDFIIKELLIELATRPTGIAYSMRSHHINKGDRKNLEEFIQPLFEKVIADLDEKILL
jgi:hypothetical protein